MLLRWARISAARWPVICRRVESDIDPRLACSPVRSRKARLETCRRKDGSIARMRSPNGGCVARNRTTFYPFRCRAYKARFLGLRSHQARTMDVAADFLQSIREAAGVARELHCGGIRREPSSRHAFDQRPKKTPIQPMTSKTLMPRGRS